MDTFLGFSGREPINSAAKTKFQSDPDSSEDATRQESLSQESRKALLDIARKEKRSANGLQKEGRGGFYVRRKREPGWKKVSSVDEADTRVRKERSTLEYSESWIGVATRTE